ncbi:hypothetical protein PYW07_012553 [Mythimna separata]|uniref:ZAD domain-containing protein n=1 Tax=Mythimna separata TaxID=271217 RepID=A0AAD8DKX3_MYTSE|nr:hypothetical protein PYW07_012553 [Mythimna separata]
MNVNKLIKCRICLVENVRMYVVANKNLQETYRKLTDVPFVTKDRRPLLACYFCYTKLKQSWRLQRKCLEAEQWFAEVLTEDYEENPQLYKDQLQFSGFVISPVKHVSIYDECQIENVTIKEELPDVCEAQDAAKQREDYQNASDQARPLVKVKIEVAEEQEDAQDVSEREDIPSKHSQTNSEHYTPIVDLKIEVEETQTQVSEREDVPRKSSDQDPIDCTPFLDVKIEVQEDEPTRYSEPEYIVPQHSMMELQNEDEQEMSRRVLGVKQKLDERRTIPEHTITTQHMRNEQATSNVIPNTQNHMPDPGTMFIKPFPQVNSNINNTEMMGHYLGNSYASRDSRPE